MKYGYFLLFCLCVAPSIVLAQRENREFNLIMRRATISLPDYSIEVHFLNKEKNVHVKADKQYAWYKGNKVMLTRGGYDGKLLDGPYKEFYTNKNLKTSGRYRLGLTKGQWDTWYTNGEHNTIEHWRSGLLHGTYKEFNQAGAIIRSGKYSHGSQTGKWSTLKDGKVVVTRWKAGKEVLIKGNQTSKESNTKNRFGSRIKAFGGKVKNFFHPHAKGSSPAPKNVVKDVQPPKKRKEVK